MWTMSANRNPPRFGHGTERVEQGDASSSASHTADNQTAGGLDAELVPKQRTSQLPRSTPPCTATLQRRDAIIEGRNIELRNGPRATEIQTLFHDEGTPVRKIQDGRPPNQRPWARSEAKVPTRGKTSHRLRDGSAFGVGRMWQQRIPADANGEPLVPQEPMTSRRVWGGQRPSLVGQKSRKDPSAALAAKTSAPSLAKNPLCEQGRGRTARPAATRPRGALCVHAMRCRRIDTRPCEGTSRASHAMVATAARAKRGATLLGAIMAEIIAAACDCNSQKLTAVPQEHNGFLFSYRPPRGRAGGGGRTASVIRSAALSALRWSQCASGGPASSSQGHLGGHRRGRWQHHHWQHVAPIRVGTCDSRPAAARG